MNYGSPYKANYEFVPFTAPHYYSGNNQKKYKGFIELEIICDSCVYIGSGYRDFIGNGREMVTETIKKDGIPVIPGSSLKGAVRTVASAVSDGCLCNDAKNRKKNYEFPEFMEKWRRFRCDASDGRRCIVCDMFGTMGWGSKVIFPEFTSDNASTCVKTVNAQFSPKIYKPGYKFYKVKKREIYELKKNVKSEFINKNSVFHGKVFFERLTKKQLELLMFSFGLNRSFHLKIGGYKNDGFGEVHIEAKSFECGELDIAPEALADNYFKEPMNEECKKSIEYLIDILGVEG